MARRLEWPVTGDENVMPTVADADDFYDDLEERLEDPEVAELQQEREVSDESLSDVEPPAKRRRLRKISESEEESEEEILDDDQELGTVPGNKDRYS